MPPNPQEEARARAVLAQYGLPNTLGVFEFGSLPPDAVARRVLIADDNRDTVELMETLLTRCGHELRVAFDGPNALRVCKDFHPDIVSLDIGLPEMDGYEVAKRMRDLPAGKAIHIVAVSGYVREADRVRALESGCSAHLAKPFDVESLSKIVDGI